MVGDVSHPWGGAGAWWTGRRVLVVGLGKSGLAAASLLHSLGARISVTEKSPSAAALAARRRLPAGVDCEIGGKRFLRRPWDLVVPSPGVPAAALRAMVSPGTPVWGELEVGYRILRAAGRWPRRSAAITGTNGKTTTTALLGAMGRAAGLRTVVAGNIGTPLCDVVSDVDENTFLVLEVSSYQLETAWAFRPTVGAVLNVTPDHLGRHGTLAAYASAKFRLFQSQFSTDTAVLNTRDPWCRRLAPTLRSSVLWFGPRASGMAWSPEGLRGLGGRWAAPAHLPGAHNGENAAAAVACARALGLSPAAIGHALRSFPGVEHRLEAVRTWRGIRFINDSKATNVDSTLVALRATGGPLFLILGGEDKGAPYAPLRPEIRRKVKEIFLIGEAAPVIRDQLKGAAPLVEVHTLEAAVQRAASVARSGDTVLLSPACASFDQFQNFEHRGREFKKRVAAL